MTASFPAVLLGQDAVEEGRFSGSQEAGENGDGNHEGESVGANQRMANALETGSGAALAEGRGDCQDIVPEHGLVGVALRPRD